MKNKNMSDIIEEYLKKVLQESENIEIRRSEVADRFQCVPSQINYVINTRFTPQKGYHVESKRGGGGYIRIMKLEIVDEAEHIAHLASLIGDNLKERDALAIIKNLYDNRIITQGEARIMVAALDRDAFYQIENSEALRAILLKRILEKLQYEH